MFGLLPSNDKIWTEGTFFHTSPVFKYSPTVPSEAIMLPKGKRVFEGPWSLEISPPLRS